MTAPASTRQPAPTETLPWITPPGPHDREPPLLMGIEPRQMQVRAQPGREAHEAEDHVLEARPDVRLTVGDRLEWLLPCQMEDHRDIVCAEAPERILVGSKLPQ